MKKIVFDSQNFNILDTLECGQTFRFLPYKKGYKVFSATKCAYAYNEKNTAVIECEDNDYDYFFKYFDLGRDYNIINERAKDLGVEIITKSAELGKGIRLLNQDLFEAAVSFIISQNNNIPRIKSIVEKLCFSLGERKSFLDEEYYTFPTSKEMSKKDIDFYKSIGLGYRAEYVKNFACLVEGGLDLKSLFSLDTKSLKSRLLSIRGIGPKVADCITLFGYKKSDSFPVDTWIEKVYKEDLGGRLSDPKKIADELSKRFNSDAGYIQQYLFYYKRSLESKNNG